MLLLLALGCGSICGKSDPLTSWPGPWAEVDFLVSDTAAVCRADEGELQHLATEGSVDGGVSVVEGALKAAGWEPEPRIEFDADPTSEARSWRKGEVLTEVRVNKSFDGKLLVTTLYDRSDKLATLWDPPEDYEAVLSAGDAVYKGLAPAIDGGRKRSCPEGVSRGPTLDYSLLRGKLPYDKGAPGYSGFEWQAFTRNAPDSDYGKDALYRFNKALIEADGAVVVRVTSYAGPGGSAGTGAFVGGSVSGTAYVVEGGQLVCQADFRAGNSETIVEGDQANDLRSNVAKAVSEALR